MYQIRIFYDRIAPDKLRRIIMAALIMMYVIYFLWNVCIGRVSSIILAEHYWMVLNCQWHRCISTELPVSHVHGPVLSAAHIKVQNEGET